MATAAYDPLKVSWKLMTTGGPNLAFHVACVIGGTLYIHGGIDKNRSTTPLNKMFTFDLEDGQQWQEVRDETSPALSHHAGVACCSRYMLLVGGWDGRVRSSDLHAFDTEKRQWKSLRTSGFPTGAGLSSHTATLLSNGNILIIGREGGTRLQRRSGNAFLLSGSIESGRFTYSDYVMGVDSRSGHTTHCIGSSLVVVGGRSDNMAAIHGGVEGSAAVPCSTMLKLSTVAQTAAAMSKPPSGRKHHAAVSGLGLVFIHGGETFDGRDKEPVGDMYILVIKPCIKWIKLPKSDIGRAGHICVAIGNSIIIHGGVGSRSVQGDLYELQL